MSDYRVFFLPVLLASVFAGSAAAMDLTIPVPNSQTHIYTHIHTPIPEPAPLFAELEKSYQTAGVCFIGFGDCGGNTDFGRSDEGFTLPDCASIGYPLTSCTPPGYPDKFCPYDSNHFASCRQDKPKACTAAYGKCVCDPCSGYDYTYEEATEKGYEVDGAACDSCGTKKYKRRNASCPGYLVCDCGPEIGSSSCQSGTLELFATCKECCANKCTLDKCPDGAVCTLEDCSGKYCATGCATGLADAQNYWCDGALWYWLPQPASCQTTEN